MTEMRLFILYIFTLLVCVICDDELLSAVVVFRHGDRTPIEPYPNDPYKNASYWPVGFGQLTNIGKMQHYELGEWFRTRYESFLSARYIDKEIYVLSTDTDRTLMSAEANLAGLYPPIEADQWSPKVDWQPIPIHTTPQFEDNLLVMKMPCPRYNFLMEQFEKAEFYVSVQEKYQDLYSYLTKYTGQSVSVPDEVEYLYSTLFIENLYNYTLPDWTKKVFPDRLMYLTTLDFAIPTFTPDLARLKAGPILNKIVEHFANATWNSKYEQTDIWTRKFLMFSGHDTTIAMVLNALGLFEYHCPPYRSSVIFELRKSVDSFYVNIFYKNSTVPNRMILKNCTFNCDFNDFKSLIKHLLITPNEWRYECRFSWYEYLPFDFIGNVLFMIGFLCALLVIASFFFAKSSSYSKLPNEDFA